MKYVAILFFACSIVALISFKNNSNKMYNDHLPGSNPFARASTLPYQAPPFDKIKNEDYGPALREGIKEQVQDIEAIANNTAAPTFENTLVALEKSGVLFNAVTGAILTIPYKNCRKTLRLSLLLYRTNCF